MSEKEIKYFFCPLYKKDIAIGLCLDINYERLHYLKAGMFDQVKKETGIPINEISSICISCPNQPFPDGDIGTAIYRSKDKK